MASVPSKLGYAKLATARILAPAKPSKSRRLLFLLSRLAKLSKTPSTNNFA